MQLPLLPNLPARPPEGSMPLGPHLADHGDTVSYREIPCQHILCPSPTAEKGGFPFSWTVNPYRGCEIGCSYCYARYTHGYLGKNDPLAFEREIFVKLGAERRVARDLTPAHFDGAEIAFGTATDPYQPAERRYRVTRGILSRLAQVPGLNLSITTKSPIILDDLPLLARIATRSRLSVHISLMSLDAGLIRKLEPKAATPEKRLRAMRHLTNAGIRAGLFLMPIAPGINDDPAAIDALEQAARAHGARFIVKGKLNLREAARPTFFAMLARHFPHLMPRYLRMIRSASRL